MNNFTRKIHARKTHARKIYKKVILIFLATLFITATAQEPAPASLPTSLPTSLPNTQVLAKEAIDTWKATAQDFSPGKYLEMEDPTTALCTDFAVIGTTPELVNGLNINFEDPQERTLDGEGTEGIVVIGYPASVGETTGQVEVALRPVDVGSVGAADEQEWEAGRVRFNVLDGDSRVLPAFFDSPLAGWVFIAFSLLLLFAFFRPNFFRNWLYLGWQAILEHRRLVIGTSILLYGLFALGLMTGLALPEACIDMATELIVGNLQTIGVVEFLSSGDVIGTAAVTAAWNFVMGAFSTTFIPALLFGIPAYLFNALRFFGLAIPFAGVFEPSLILHLPTLIIELMAYIIVTAGGGMLLVTLIKKGFRALPEGLRKLWLMLPIALVLLVIGAWYESFSLIVLRNLIFGGP